MRHSPLRSVMFKKEKSRGVSRVALFSVEDCRGVFGCRGVTAVVMVMGEEGNDPEKDNSSEKADSVDSDGLGTSMKSCEQRKRKKLNESGGQTSQEHPFELGHVTH